MAAVATILRDIFDDDDDNLEFDGFGPEYIESDIDLNDVLNELSTDNESENEDERRLVVPPPLGNVDRDFSPITVNDFVRETGPVLPETFDVDTASPIDYFYLFFNENQFSTIARHTNNYARWHLKNEGRFDPKWSDTHSFVATSDIKYSRLKPELLKYSCENFENSVCFIWELMLNHFMYRNSMNYKLHCQNILKFFCSVCIQLISWLCVVGFIKKIAQN